MKDTATNIVTLTSDFGLKDAYVAAMKGVLLSTYPQAQLVDITHQIPAQNISAAAQILLHACPYFPRGSVHLAVIDPGVGSERKGVVVQSGGHCFVGPDNGVFGLLIGQWGLSGAWEIQNAALCLDNVSNTFHGRDVFAPVAARLASGMSPDLVGPELQQLVTLESSLKPIVRNGVVSGKVVWVDHFGNLLTNIEAQHLRPTGTTITCAGRNLPLVSTYADGNAGELTALVGSNGYLELAIPNGSAAEFLDAGAGLAVQVEVG